MVENGKNGRDAAENGQSFGDAETHVSRKGFALRGGKVWANGNGGTACARCVRRVPSAVSKAHVSVSFPKPNRNLRPHSCCGVQCSAFKL